MAAKSSDGPGSPRPDPKDHGDDKAAWDKAAWAERFIAALPFSRAVGMRLESIGDGFAKISMPYSENLIGDPATGVIHGGAVSALMDTCGGAAVMSHPESAAPTATIDLRIDYMRAARPHQRVTAEAQCYHVTRSVAFVRAVARDEEDGTPVATASGAFTFQRTRAKTSKDALREDADPLGHASDTGRVELRGGDGTATADPFGQAKDP